MDYNEVALSNKEDFILISQIEIDNTSSWKGKKVLTFDIDWACDEAIEYTVDILEEANLSATFFITHDTPIIHRVRKNRNLELGIHPNFNSVMNKCNTERSVNQLISKLKDLVPEAVSLRGHSLTTSAKWLDLYKEMGIKFLSNYMMYGVENIQPFRHINGLIECPIFFSDDGHVRIVEERKEHSLTEEKIVTPMNEGLYIYDFHPTNIALNIESPARYQNSKTVHQQWGELQHYRNQRYGVDNILRCIIS